MSFNSILKQEFRHLLLGGILGITAEHSGTALLSARPNPRLTSTIHRVSPDPVKSPARNDKIRLWSSPAARYRQVRSPSNLRLQSIETGRDIFKWAPGAHFRQPEAVR